MSVWTRTTEDKAAILVVEDSPTQAEALSYLLRRQGYQVRVAGNGRQALDLLREQQPNLVISDILMPNMNGYELCRYLKADASNGDIPVILLTSLSDPADVLEGLECGADSFITKPYSEDYLLAHIQQILANWRLRLTDRVRVGVEILFAGKRRFISADQQQMLSLLLSTYEAAVQRNHELVETQEELRALNEHLEDKVTERTAALTAEMAERKRLEEQLVEHDATLKAILESALTPVFSLDRDFRYTSFNRVHAAAMQALYGVEIEIGHSLSEYQTVPEDREIARKNLDRVLRGESLVESAFSGEPGRARRYYQIVHNPIRNAAGEVMGMSVFASDVTERKQAEQAWQEYSARLEADVAQRTQALRDAQEQLVRQEKLAVLGQLAGSVAHELRNPLGVIANAVYFLHAVQPNCDPVMLDYLNIISAEVNSADKIVTDLLDFARLKGVARETVSLADLVERTLQKHPPAPKIAAAIEYPDGLPPLFVDPRQIEQVLTNLVVNAYQAMPEGGSLTLRAEVVSEPLSACPEPPFVSLQVTDTGIGISAENMHRLFEPLFTTKAKGIGLGLAVSKKLIEANGGKIEVQSAPGQGTTVTVCLPCREARL